MPKKRHTKTGYYAELGRKGGNATKRNHPPARKYYQRTGAKGGAALKKKKGYYGPPGKRTRP